LSVPATAGAITGAGVYCGFERGESGVRGDAALVDDDFASVSP
jgi:hypothetical protein